MYLKDERALDEYLLRIAAERAPRSSSRTATRAHRGASCKELLEKVISLPGAPGEARRAGGTRASSTRWCRRPGVDETTLLDMDALNAEVEKMHG